MRYRTLLLLGTMWLGACGSDSRVGLDAALYDVALRGDVHSVDRLVARGANVNARSFENSNETPLHAAVDKGHIDVVRRLLRAGANPELRNRRGDRPIDFLQGQRYDQDKCKVLLVAAARRAS